MDSLLSIKDAAGSLACSEAMGERSDRMSETMDKYAFSVPSKGGTLKERELCPISAVDFLAQDWGEEIDWVWEDYLPVGGLVMLAAKPKVGKSTLAYDLAVKVAQGEPFLGRQTTRGGVLILALEEHPRDVRLRLKALGAECDNLYIHAGRLKTSSAVFGSIEQFAKEHDINLILVDTLAMFWRIVDENDPAALTRAVQPLLDLARETGACVLLIHHFRKSEGTEGDEVRGTSALLASLDVALLLYRHTSEKQRRLRAIGRYADTPPELIIALEDAEYTVIGKPSELNAPAERERLLAALSATPEDLETLSRKATVPLKKAYRHMQALVSDGKAQQHGKGVKGNPSRYSVPLENALSSSPPPVGEEGESELDVSAGEVISAGHGLEA